MRASLGDGRFGPIFVADDPASGRRVVIRTFGSAVTADQRDGLIAALRELCDIPLDHPSIARPVSCGIEGDRVYLAHAYLPGMAADDFLRTAGPQPLAELAPRLTQVAAALDFAAAAGVHHGDLTLRDVIFGGDVAGVSGLGVAEALERAGVESPVDQLYAARERDLRALASLTRQLVVPSERTFLDRLVASLPDTALAFAAGVQEIAAHVEPAVHETALYATEALPDLPLVRDVPTEPLPIVPTHVQTAPAAESDAIVIHEPHHRRGWLPFAVAASIAVALLAGFAGGYVVGRRDAPPQTVAVVTPPLPTATTGQVYTDQGIEAVTTPEPVPPVEAAPPVKPAPAPEPSGPGALFVDSHPAGAQVFVDGALVGRTPLLVNGVRPGAHAVRMTMPMHRMWATTVDVPAGTRARVAASLEEVY